MKNSALILLVVILLASGAAFLLYKNSATPAPQAPVVTAVPEATPTEALPEGAVEVVLDSVVGSPVQQSGKATLIEVAGKVNVSVVLTGDTVANPQPIHFHSGTCAKPGPVVYPLTNVVNGKSETVLNVDMKTLQASAATLINVHKSAAEQSVYTACGELPEDEVQAPTSGVMMEKQEASPSPRGY